MDGYTTLASSLLERWNALASKMASKLDAGTYDAASAAEDMAAGTSLATEAAWLYASEWCKTLGAIIGQQRAAEVSESQAFTAPAGARLELTGPLVKGPGKLAQLPVSAVHIEPAQLAAGETAFKLRADASGYRGATYAGTVTATTDDGNTTAVTVWITVP
jgi:hypothetical protein